MSDVDFKRMVYIFLCITLFSNSYYIINPRHLSFLEDLNTFGSYAWGIDEHEELMRELAVSTQTWLQSGRPESRARGIFQGIQANYD